MPIVLDKAVAELALFGDASREDRFDLSASFPTLVELVFFYDLGHKMLDHIMISLDVGTVAAHKKVFSVHKVLDIAPIRIEIRLLGFDLSELSRH